MIDLAQQVNNGAALDTPITHTQSLILTGQLLQPNDPLYNMVMVFDIHGAISLDSFEEAFACLVKNCDAMRIIFTTHNAQAKQHILKQIEYDLTYLDFSAQPQPHRAYKKWETARKTINFTLSECLFDSALIKLNDERYIWYFNQHHLVTDAWSTELIYRYVNTCYVLANQSRLDEAPALPKFADYAFSEKELNTTKRFSRAQKYWSQHLDKSAGASTFYRSVPLQKSSTTLRHKSDFGEVRTSKFRALLTHPDFAAFSNDLGLMQMFATVLYSYLHRVTGNNSLAIGTPCHSRTTNTLKQTAGVLINVLPLQINIDDNESFTSLYKKVAQANQALLINAIPGANQTPHMHAFDVVLNYLTASFEQFDGMPMNVNWEHPDSGDRNHLMRLQVQNFDQTSPITLFFDLNIDAFQNEEAQWAIAHFMILADAFLADPNQVITAPSLLVSPSAQKINQPRNTLIETNSNGGSIVERLHESVTANPHKAALICTESKLSYIDLDHKSNLVAHYLLSNTMPEHGPIAVFMERSSEAIIAILGILKAGRCFLPIDVNYPASRADYILDDAKVGLVISSQQHSVLLAQHSYQTLRIDTDWHHIENYVSNQKLPSILSDSSAYIIYTSGSTGQPKGVELSHGGLQNYLNWASHYYLQGNALNFPLFSSLSFDLTITSIFLPLISGATLIIYPESQAAPGMTIRNVIEDNRVDIIKLTPAHLTLIQSMDFSSSTLKKLIVGGDDFKTELALTFDTYFAGNIEIYNEYGPTEATVACTVHRFSAKQDKSASVPIGKPIDNASIYILDEHLNAVPQGVVGEIYIGGLGLAKGYLHKPDLSQERFINYTNDSLNTPLRLYKTGDLATFNEQGIIAYLGRNDHQVKVRGVRIETGEIESAMLGITQVKDVIVDLASRFGLDNPDDGIAMQVEHCTKCGLAANHPSAQLDDAKICRICRIYEKQAEQAQSYYQDLPTLQAWIERIKGRSKGKQDSIMLLSGGKDSSYTLCKLVDMGLTPLVFTLDNGYISDGAKANMQRLVDRLGLELVIGQTDAMDDIFVDSLNRFSNVCNGCFKTIYTMSMKLAKERGISVICTGLSRGQIFETRVAHLFQQGCFSPDKIDERIIEARKAYHRTDDIISRRLDVQVFQDDDIFEQVQYLDYFRFADVTLDEIYDYLHNIAPWIRPSDTGRSTNCLINDAGIYVHKMERGYHNYALPYSWDVRLGHKDRDAALDELNDELDQQKVDDILDRVGYQKQKNKLKLSREDTLVAYYSGPVEIQKSTLQSHLGETLPKEYIPSQFVWLKELPLNVNGKIDRTALPKPQQSTRELNIDYVAPSSEVETTLANLWQQLLGIKEVGINDNFFDLGGDSIVNIQIVSAARELGIDISPQQVFDHPTIQDLAEVAGRIEMHTAQQGKLIANVDLSPIQHAFFEKNSDYVNANTFAQSVTLAFTADFSLPVFEHAFQTLIEQHDALRARFTKTNEGWKQNITSSAHTQLTQLTLKANDKFDDIIEQERTRLIENLSIKDGRLVSVTHVASPDDNKQYVLLVIHHLVIDGVSWWILLNDLAQLCEQIAQHRTSQQANKTCSIDQWQNALSHYINSQDAQVAEHYWTHIYSPQSNTAAVALSQQNALYHCRLSEQDTNLLIQKVPAAYKVHVPDVLMTALNLCLSWFVDQQLIEASHDLVVDIEGHGREDIVKGLDITRTIAWFTSIYPVALKVPTDNIGQVLRVNKEGLRSIPNNGIDYGLLHYTSQNQSIKDVMSAHPPARVLFNYMGQWDRTLNAGSPFKFVYPISAHHGEHTHSSHPLELNAMIYEGQLHIDFTYDTALFSTNVMEELSTQYKQHLKALIEYCITQEETGFTPSDFPSARIDQGDLEDLFDEFGEE